MQTHWEKHANAVKTRAAGELPPVIEKKWVRMAEFYLRKRSSVGVSSIQQVLQQIMASKWGAALEANAVSDDVDPNAEAIAALEAKVDEVNQRLSGKLDEVLSLLRK